MHRRRYSALLAYLVPHFNPVARAVFVVPHFELLRCRHDANAAATQHATDAVPKEIATTVLGTRIPATYTALEAMLASGEVIPFHTRPELLIPGFPAPTNPCYGFPRNKSWPQGVGATNYSRWFYESSHKWQGFIRLDRSWNPEAYLERFWEPFLIVRKVMLAYKSVQ